MSYILLKRLNQPGFRFPYSTVFESNNLDDVVKQFKQQIVGGCRPDDLKIVKDMPFEFECAVKFEEEV